MPNKTSFSQVLGNGVFPCACRGITAPVTQAPEPSPQTEPLPRDCRRACPVLLMQSAVEVRQKLLCKSEFIPLGHKRFIQLLLTVLLCQKSPQELSTGMLTHRSLPIGIFRNGRTLTLNQESLDANWQQTPF